MSRGADGTADGRGGAALYTLLSVMFINMLGFGVIVPLLPFYGQSFHAPPWAIALVFSAYSVGAFFGEPFWGRLSDRIGRKPILISTTAANCACYLALTFAPNIETAILVRVLGGLFAGNASVVQGYIADVTPAEHRAGRMAMLGAAFNLGFIVGPFVGGVLAKPSAGPIGFQIPLLLAAGLSLSCSAGIALAVPESRARSVAETHGSSRWKMFRIAFAHPVVGRLMALTFAVGFAFSGIESVFALWTHHRFAWEPRNVGLAFGLSGVISSASQFLLTGPLSRRYGEANMLAVGMAGSVVCNALQPFSDGRGYTVALLALMALFTSIAFPNAGALMSRAVHEDHQGQVMGLNNAVAALARITGPLCMGFAFAGVSVNAPFVIGALITAPAIMLALGAGRAAHRQETPFVGGQGTR